MFFDHNTPQEGYAKIINMSSSPGHLNYSGIALSLFSVDDFTFGEIGYINNNQIKKIKLETETDISNLLFVCVEKFIKKNNYGLFLVDGFIQHDDWNLETYKKMYVDSSSEGRFSQDDEQTLKFEIGLATSSKIFYFNSFTPSGGQSTGGTGEQPVTNYITNSVPLTPNTTSYDIPTILTNSPVYIIGEITIAYTQYCIFHIENDTDVIDFESGDLPGYLTSYTLPELLSFEENVEYYWKIRYKDNTDKYHSWSSLGHFKILPSFLANLIVVNPQNEVVPPLSLEMDFDIIGNVTCLSYRYQIFDALHQNLLYDSNEQVYSSNTVVMYNYSYENSTTYTIRFCLKDSKNKWTDWSGYFTYSIKGGWETFDGTNRSLPIVVTTEVSIGNISIGRMSNTRLIYSARREFGYCDITGITATIISKSSSFYPGNTWLTTHYPLTTNRWLHCYYAVGTSSLYLNSTSDDGLIMNTTVLSLSTSVTTNSGDNVIELSLFPINAAKTLFCVVMVYDDGFIYWVATLNPTTYALTHNTASLHSNNTNKLATESTLSEIHYAKACPINLADNKFITLFRDRSGSNPRSKIHLYQLNTTTFTTTHLNASALSLTGGDCWYNDIIYLEDNYCFALYANNSDPGYATRCHLIKLNGNDILKSDPLILNANGYNPSCMLKVSNGIILVFHNTDKQIHVIKYNKDLLTLTKLNQSPITYDALCSSVGTDWSATQRRYMSACMVDEYTVALFLVGDRANRFTKSILQLFKI